MSKRKLSDLLSNRKKRIVYENSSSKCDVIDITLSGTTNKTSTSFTKRRLETTFFEDSNENLENRNTCNIPHDVAMAADLLSSTGNNFKSTTQTASRSKDNSAVNEHGETELDIAERNKMYETLDTNRIKSEAIDFAPLDLPSQLKCVLKPHQLMALKRMINMETKFQGGMLCDDQGLGKTIEMLALIVTNPPEYLKQRLSGGLSTKSKNDIIIHGTTLVICPASVVNQWQDELFQHTEKGTLKVLKWHGSNKTRSVKKLQRYDVVITTFASLATDFLDENKLDREDPMWRTKRKYIDKLKDRPLFNMSWYRIVLDEAHSIKNKQTTSHKACCVLRSQYRWALTGTPIHNTLEDLYSLFKFCRLKPYESHMYWKRHVTLPSTISTGYHDRITHVPGRSDSASWSVLWDACKKHLIRRTKLTRQEHYELPLIPLPTRHVTIRLDVVSAVEAADYQNIWQYSQTMFDLYRRNDGVQEHYMDFLVLLLRLRLFCDHPLLAVEMDKRSNKSHDSGSGEGSDSEELLSDHWIEDDSYKNELQHRLMKTTANMEKSLKKYRSSQAIGHMLTDLPFYSTKMKALFKELKEMRDNDPFNCGVIFSQFTKFLDILEKPLKEMSYEFVRLDGSMTQDQRQVAVKAFNEATSTKLFLISLKAGGVGLNLTRASHVFILDPWWNPALEEQAIDRVHRIGQSQAVKVFRFILSGTIEEQILNLQKRKRALAQNALNEIGGPRAKTLSIKEMFQIFRGKFLQNKAIINGGEPIEDDDRSDTIPSSGGTTAASSSTSTATVAAGDDLNVHEVVPHKEKWIPTKSKKQISRFIHVPTLKDICLKYITTHFNSIVANDDIASSELLNAFHRLNIRHTVTDKQLDTFVNLPEVESLHLRCQQLGYESFNRIGNDCKKLRTLELMYTNKFRTRNFENIIENNHASIESLAIAECGEVLTDSAVDNCLRSCGQLKHVNFSCAYNITKLLPFLTKTPLQSLNLSFASELTLHSDILSLNYKQGNVAVDLSLTDLDLSYATSLETRSLSALIKVCKSIISFKISGLSAVKDNLLIQIAESPSWSQQLQVLKLDGCLNISDRGVVALTESCFNIKELNLALCSTVTAIGCNSLYRLYNLEKLNLGRLGGIGDGSIRNIANHCDMIEELNLNYALDITSGGVIAITSLKYLKDLDLSFARSAVRTESISKILQDCERLRFLQLYGVETEIEPDILERAMLNYPHILVDY